MQKQTSTNLVRICVAALVAALIVTQPILSFGFKPITHVWIAQQVLNDLDRLGNKVVIDGKEYIVDSDIAEAIKENSGAYRMGFIGPDAIPDIMVGQMAIHPGDPANAEGWQADRWLRELLNASDDKASRSFAYGYIGHAASDIFAHTYVNTYAGDVFEILDAKEQPGCDIKVDCLVERARGIDSKTISRFGDEEKRHFALESFIATYTPPIRNYKNEPIDPEEFLTVPHAKVADFFLKNDAVLKAYDDRVFTWHLLIMAAHRRNVEELAKPSGSAAAEVAELKVELDAEAADIEKQSRSPELLSAEQKEALKDRRTYLNKINELIKRLDDRVASSSTSAKDWLDNIDLAMDAYIEMGRDVAIELAKDNGDPREPFNNWLKKHGPLLFHPKYSEPIGEIQDQVEDIKEWLEKIKKKPGIRIAVAVKEFLDRMSERLKRRATIAAVGVVFGKSNRDLVKVIYNPDKIDSNKLNRIFKTDANKKKLLKIPNMAERAIHDMYAGGGSTFDPDNFSAVKHAVTLAKLSLLRPGELNRLVRHYHSESPDVFTSGDHDPNFNILFGAVRSIDGDHQWNEFAPPYLRSDNSGCTAPLRYYGYADDGSGKGFKLWTNEKLRTQVFMKLFDTMIAPGMYDDTFSFPTKLDPCYTDRYRPTHKDPFPIIKAHPKKISG